MALETRYLRLDKQKSMNSEKDILQSQIHLIGIQKSINNYKDLRKKEFELKSKIKSSISSLKSEINLLQSSFPEQKKPLEIKPKKKVNAKTYSEYEKTDLNLQNEIEDIRRKLAKLG